jgi:broad specificity phosphatase PhoE
VCDRVDRVIERVTGLSGACLVVGHGKLLQALGARWVGAGVEFGSALPMNPAAISVLERQPAGERLRLWNYTSTALDGR